MVSDSLIEEIASMLHCPRGDSGCSECKKRAQIIVKKVRQHTAEPDEDTTNFEAFRPEWDGKADEKAFERLQGREICVLKPCPFCGELPEYIENASGINRTTCEVSCSNEDCGCRPIACEIVNSVATSSILSAKACLFVRWNERAHKPVSSDDVIGRLDEAKTIAEEISSPVMFGRPVADRALEIINHIDAVKNKMGYKDVN